MLGKLIKYEFKATARIYLPFFALLVLLTGVNCIFAQVGYAHSDTLKIPALISMLLYFVAVIAIFVIAMVATIQRFYKNFMTDEGYLMFTLPVKQDQLILSKLIVAVIWNTFSVLIACFSVFSLVADADVWNSLWRSLNEFAARSAEMGINLWPPFLITLIACLAGLIAGILQIYAAIVIGCTVPRHKLILGLGVYLGFNVVMQTVSMLCIPYLANWMDAVAEQGGSPTAIQGVQLFQAIMLFGLAFSLLFGAVYYIITRLLLKKKLNLE